MSLPKTVASVLRASVARPGTAESFADAVSRAGSDELAGLAPAAVRHGIGGYVHAAARNVDCLPVATRQQLDRLRQHTLLHHLHVMADLEHLGRILDEAQVPWLVVKGPFLAEVIHGHPALRAYADLDILVPPAYLGEALEALRAGGCCLRDRNWALIHRELKGEVHVAMPAGTMADVHWHLLSKRDVRESFGMRISDVFERAQEVEVGRRRVRTLCDVDTVVYLALHTMLSGGHRLLWLKDIERMLDVRAPDMAAVAKRARDWGADLVLATALQRTAAAVGLPPCAEVLRTRQPGTRLWLTLSAVAWRAAPAEREDGTESIARAVARSGRPSLAASLRLLLHKAWLRVFARTHDSRRSPNERLDPTNPMSDQFDAGGLEAQRAFLDDVRREASVESVGRRDGM